VLICGHYEGVDGRVAEHLVDGCLSIGDYVLTGGELAAMVVVDVAAGNLFVLLVMTALVSIVLGMGMPTTAAYAVAASVVAPGLVNLGVPLLTAHFFVFYYGVLADITPPVALAAYAAAGIAGSNPFKTGNTAFRLGIAKALVPFVFVYSPALLLVTDGFTWLAFTTTLIGAMTGIGFLGVAFSGFLLAPLTRLERWWIGIASLLFIAPEPITFGIGAIAIAPILIRQMLQARHARREVNDL